MLRAASLSNGSWAFYEAVKICVGIILGERFDGFYA